MDLPHYAGGDKPGLLHDGISQYCPASAFTSEALAHAVDEDLVPIRDRAPSESRGCLLESQRLAKHEEADRLLQTSGLRLRALGGLYPTDVPSTM